jgi:hypothetical protein
MNAKPYDKFESFKKYEVQANSVADFLQRFYKADRYHGRGKEYAAVLLTSHEADFAAEGFDIISHHDSVTGNVVSFYGSKK